MLVGAHPVDGLLDLASDEGLETAILLSLELDRRAEDSDKLPGGDDADRRGWWGDQFLPVKGDRYGSRLWLLARAKKVPETARDAETYVREATAWMIEDKVLERIDVAVEMTDLALAILVTPYRPGRDPVKFRFEYAWAAEAAKVRA